MHTLIVILGGLLLFAILALIGRSIPWLRHHLLAVFTLFWFIASAINMTVGIVHAGYSFMAELPIFFVVFLVPVALAWAVNRKRQR
ncbi:MAG TPA: hypothetical protein DC022_13985 [Alcanivorax sp.]|jgi:hypothetical protein|uniref:hypothetical protein n=1 Tax=Alcanivorax TaxID=59753 RepID=UPI000C58A68A|nr:MULTISPECIES: hypothetical protein [Alcanivorax]MAC15516.1 hypothetical protein [Alcanivorax sp.]MBG31522.1 hypothetical protein [Alcanivorax sp.]MBL4570237.1 hypothetical protein [Alcanivorax sp.]MDF1636981.1 hypothetical protein [Alcanivorax jadensis]HBC19817.1 hypothetical protein [Alcanivorax sp.]|tara:strand:- start:1464 stop:1721 length:258 start_codon:yes stop_codon:yes gene_type:complete